MYQYAQKDSRYGTVSLNIFFGLIINIFFVSLVDETLLSFKSNAFIITGSIFSNEYVKQVVLINHSWVSPALQKGWGLEFCLFFKKWGRVDFFQKKEEVAK